MKNDSNQKGDNMTWDEFLEENSRINYIRSDYEDTNIECPHCGSRLHKYVGIVLTTYPPKYRYECFNCGWMDCA